jgi:glycerol-3-phosphate dehydrogenase
MKTLGRSYEKSPTLTEPLPGARGGIRAGGSMDELSPELQQGLVARYGTRAGIVARIADEGAELARSLAPESSVIGAEVIHAARNEFARSLADFLARRTAVTWRAPAAARASAPQVARLMGQELGWSLERQQRELELFVEFLNRGRLGVCDDPSTHNFH